LETPEVISITRPRAEVTTKLNAYTIAEPVKSFPADYQYLSSSNRKMIKDEVIGYIQAAIIDKGDRKDIIALYDTFKIDASSRKNLRELTDSFL
jgi:hypothetical protein